MAVPCWWTRPRRCGSMPCIPRRTSSTRNPCGEREVFGVIPEDLRYTSEHEWVRAVGEGGPARVGITHYAQDSLGDIVYVQLPEPGTAVSAGDTMGEVESTKSVSDIFAPVTGTVAARN